MPNTDTYLALGLLVIAVVLGGYVLGLALRFSNARKDVRVLEQLKED
jgi:hypothetical protein